MSIIIKKPPEINTTSAKKKGDKGDLTKLDNHPVWKGLSLLVTGFIAGLACHEFLQPTILKSKNTVYVTEVVTNELEKTVTTFLTTTQTVTIIQPVSPEVLIWREQAIDRVLSERERQLEEAEKVFYEICLIQMYRFLGEEAGRAVFIEDKSDVFLLINSKVIYQTVKTVEHYIISDSDKMISQINTSAPYKIEVYLPRDKIDALIRLVERYRKWKPSMFSKENTFEEFLKTTMK